ncbi:YbhB/YbcL family Raf kinase inhibitor-like protein [Hydrogenimonas sp.]|jgi:Raf kinase inhibitor-like YbhB/YbcL family protein|uniref:YbhB/YbcL family Raf kinase inhibitor-like protein n=1 Tax=Hydrogenimonas sp. TaxID=2231112 RepID=UPI002625B0B6|nr:YbhB/YbcL family Raf kinase inhibitor-like protein [Hydrogenimonas sp.]
MILSSPAFENGGFIPARYTCDGADVSIPLEFADVPEGTKSLALIMDDPDAPMGIFVHWVIYNIPADVTSLPEGIPNEPYLSEGIRQGVNSFGNIGYGGPCPPNGAHRYMFKLYALDIPLEIDAGLTKHQLLSQMDGHVIDGAGLMGIYER